MSDPHPYIVRRIECIRCGCGSYVPTYYPGFYYYRAHNGTITEVSRAVYWCVKCNRAEWCESFPKVEEIRQRLQEANARLLPYLPKGWRLTLASWFSFRARSDDERALLREIVRLRKLYEFVGSRKSGPRCLECGSEEICGIENLLSPETKHTTSVIHPRCGGKLEVKVIAIDPDSGPRFMPAVRKDRYYNHDGVRLN